jgi:hypothetical protein
MVCYLHNKTHPPKQLLSICKAKHHIQAFSQAPLRKAKDLLFLMQGCSSMQGSMITG